MFPYLKFLCTSVFMCMLCTSNAISESSENHQSDDKLDETSKVYMALSGGGYHAHAGASAVMMSLMDRVGDNADMSRITKNIDAISSNSGGSWFLSQAAYTDKFRTSLEETNAWLNYTKRPERDVEGGYLGEAYDYIDTHKIDIVEVCSIAVFWTNCKNELQSSDSYLRFLLSGVKATSPSPSWHQLAENAVFGAKFTAPWQEMAEYAKSNVITSDRQEWAKDKSLIFASALLTDAPALNGIIKIKSLAGYQDSLDGRLALVPGATPVMFTIPNVSSNFVPGGDVTLQYGHWDKTFVKEDKIQPYTLRQEVEFGNASVLDVAASSSAAGAGFIDIPNMAKSTFLDIRAAPAHMAAFLDNFAPAFTFANEGGAEYKTGSEVKDMKLANMSAKGLARLADGGFVDNTAVAYMVKFMEDNGKLKNDFNILAMDNYPSQPLVYINSGAKFTTGPDVAGLFGFPYKDATTHTVPLFGKFQYTGIVPHIFKSDAYFTGKDENITPVKGEENWCAWIEPNLETETEKCVIINTGNQSGHLKEHCNLYLSYTRYKVEVKANKYFGIKGGVKGNLHVFAILGKNTGVVPDTEFQYGCYVKLMKGVHTVVTGDNLFGNTLASKLGLSTE